MVHQDLAINAITGGKHKPQNQSPLVGLASSLLGGQHGGQSSHSSGGSGSIGGMAGQLVGSFFDSGGKPQQQQQQQSAASQQSGGGFLNFLGGHHGSSVRATHLCWCRFTLIRSCRAKTIMDTRPAGKAQAAVAIQPKLHQHHTSRRVNTDLPAYSMVSCHKCRSMRP